MEPIVISDDEEDDDVSDEAVEVPPFVPPPKQEATPPSAATEPKEPPGAEISFSNLTKEACRQLKEAFVKWLQCSEVLPALSLSQPEEVRVSGKFRLECIEKETPRVVFLPTRRAILTEQQIKSPATFNETIDKMFEVPLYERSSARLPGEDRSSGRMPIIQRMQCYNCGSYHHQIRSCRRPPQRQHFDRPRTSDFGRGRGRGTPSEGRLREESGKRSSQQLPPGNGTGTAFKKLRMEKGFILGSEATSGSANNKTKENGIPRVKVSINSKNNKAKQS